MKARRHGRPPMETHAEEEQQQESSAALDADALQFARASRLLKRSDVFLELCDRFDQLARRAVAELSGIQQGPE